MLASVSASRGWFPDPAGRGGYRWWDGSGWTRYLADDPGAPAPEIGSGTEPAREQVRADRVPSEHAAESRPRRARPQTARPADAPAGRSATATITRPAPAYPPGYDGPVRPRRAPQQPRRRSLLVALVAVAVLVVLAAGIAIWQQDSELIYPSQNEPTVAPVQDDGSYDDNTRELAIPGMRMTMPAKPYLTVGLTKPRNGVFERNGGALVGGAYTTALVQANYSGSNDWMAMIRAGRVEDSLAEDGDLEAIADRVLEAELKDSYPDDVELTIKKRKEETLTGNLPRPARIINLQVHYSVPGLKSKYDRVSVLVSSRPDGDGYNGWIGMRPDNSSQQIEDGYSEVTKSLTLE